MARERGLMPSIVLSILLLCGAARAQNFEATLTGLASDPSGALIAGVTVRLSNLDTGRAITVRTNQSGAYTVAGLVPGAYELTAELTGFKKYLQSGITLQVNQSARVDFTMQLGALTEAVQVTAETPLVNSETGAKGQVITNHEIVDLPLNGRDFHELAYLTPGVVDLPEGIATSNSGVTAINGGRADGVNYLVDGLNNRNVRDGAPIAQPSVDAVLEFKVQTSAYAADFGTVGSGLINVALKAGTNQFHGSLYEFARDDAFDARSFFDPGKSPLRRHQYGGTLGGPVRLPRYNGRDRTHFFVSYEGLTQQRGDARLVRVPTLTDRAGNFSALLQGANRIFLRDPTISGTCGATVQTACFPGNIIPASRVHPIATKILKLVPLPNREGANNFQTSQVSEAANRNNILKLDQRLTDRLHMALTYVGGANSGVNPYGASNLPGFGLTSEGATHLAGLHLTQVIRPAITNSFRFSYSRSGSVSDWQRRDDPALLDAVQALTIAKDPVYNGMPRVTITGFDQIGHHASYPGDIMVNGFQYIDTLSIVKGKHYLRVGAEFNRSQYFQYYPNNSRGTITFQGRVTGGTATPVPMADFLLGLPDTSSRLLSPRKNYLFYNTAAGFAQDDYRITRRLTLNIGVRYDFLPPPVEKFNLLSNFVPELRRIVVAGDAALPRSLVYSRKKNFAPRFGFAWRPWDSNRWVVRGGYGLFFTNSAQNGIRILLANNSPYSESQNFSRSTADPLAFTISDPFPTSNAGVVAAALPSGVSSNSPPSYMQNFNFTIERQIAAQLVAEISYAGSLGLHLSRKYDVNQQIRFSPQQIARPFPQYSGAIQYVSYGGKSNYHALQTTVRRSFRSGVGFRANFVWSKAIDDTSGLTGTGSEGAAQDSRNLRLERGQSGFNRPRAFTLDFSYLLPLGRGRLVRGWQVNGILRAYDGQPFTPADSTFNFAQGGASRPDRIGDGRLANPSVERWFNVSDFVRVPTGAFRFGTSGRDILSGPPKRQLDVSLLKTFTLPREYKLQFRAEVFNVPNIANFYLPVANVDVSNAATITRAQPGREVQLGLKFLF
ncbi:MAG: TonB-dependent receptor [Candidatus Solibacter usitatus]|nr:TonB-dependent receptor [Candidatus Solibacter usitatus]